VIKDLALNIVMGCSFFAIPLSFPFQAVRRRYESSNFVAYTINIIKFINIIDLDT